MHKPKQVIMCEPTFTLLQNGFINFDKRRRVSLWTLYTWLSFICGFKKGITIIFSYFRSLKSLLKFASFSPHVKTAFSERMRRLFSGITAYPLYVKRKGRWHFCNSMLNVSETHCLAIWCWPCVFFLNSYKLSNQIEVPGEPSPGRGSNPTVIITQHPE